MVENHRRQTSTFDIYTLLASKGIPALQNVFIDPLLVETDRNLFKSKILDVIKVYFDPVKGNHRVSSGQGSHLHNDELERFPEYMSALTIEDITISRISGAMTNCVYFVSILVPLSIESEVSDDDILKEVYTVNLGPGLPERRLIKRVVLRIYGREASEFIRRDREIFWVTKLSKQGVSPSIFGVFGNGRVEQHLNSRTLNKADIRNIHYSRQIGNSLLKVHNLIRRSPTVDKSQSEIWTRLSSWYSLAKKSLKQCEGKSAEKYNRIVQFMNGKTLEDMWAMVQQLKEEIDTSFGKDLVFSHNDLQYGNILSLVRRKRNAYDRVRLSSSLGKSLSNVASPSLSRRPSKQIGSIPHLNHLTQDDDDLQSQFTNITNTGTEDIESDTETEEVGLALVDFEYSGINYRCYDMANHFCEWMADYHCEESYKMNRESYPNINEQRIFLDGYLDALLFDLNKKEAQRIEKARSICQCTSKDSIALDKNNDILPDSILEANEMSKFVHDPIPDSLIEDEEYNKYANLVVNSLSLNVEFFEYSESYCKAFVDDSQEIESHNKDNTALEENKCKSCKSMKRFSVTDNTVQILLQNTAKLARISHALWAFWGVIQCNTEEIDFDFVGYAGERWSLFMDNFGGDLSIFN